MVVVVLLFVVGHGRCSGFGSLSIAVLWSLNLADSTKDSYWQKRYTV